MIDRAKDKIIPDDVIPALVHSDADIWVGHYAHFNQLLKHIRNCDECEGTPWKDPAKRYEITDHPDQSDITIWKDNSTGEKSWLLTFGDGSCMFLE